MIGEGEPAHDAAVGTIDHDDRIAVPGAEPVIERDDVLAIIADRNICGRDRSGSRHSSAASVTTRQSMTRSSANARVQFASVRMSRMLEMLRDLAAHKGHANASLLNAVRQNGTAASDPELLELLHHILLANRFWLLTVLGEPFVLDDEAHPSSSFDALVQRYASTHAQESAWLETASEGDLARILDDSRIPGGTCSVAQALMQVCMHSHGHRAQCAKLLRRHGGVPPATDFILWVTSRPRMS